MKYFLIEADNRISQIPQIVGWHNKLDVRDINLENAYKLPKRELLFIRENEDTIFTDIISDPFFLVSEKVKKVILMYEPKTILREIVLLDKAYAKTERYFLPILQEIECLSDESVLNLDKSEIKKAIICKDKITNETLFKIAGVSRQYIVGNLDIVESILKREVIGVQIKELEVV